MVGKEKYMEREFYAAINGGSNMHQQLLDFIPRPSKSFFSLLFNSEAWGNDQYVILLKWHDICKK